MQRETHLVTISYHKYRQIKSNIEPADNQLMLLNYVAICRNRNPKDSDVKTLTNMLNPITDIFNIETGKQIRNTPIYIQGRL